MNEDLNLSNYILDFNFPIPKDLRNNFQGIFSYIKKNSKLNIRENLILIVYSKNVRENFLKLFMK